MQTESNPLQHYQAQLLEAKDDVIANLQADLREARLELEIANDRLLKMDIKIAQLRRGK